MSEINSLSEREIEILKLVATGASNKEIASKLFISANTVKVHLRNIFAKIGVESRTEAAMFVVNAGLLTGQTAAPQTSGVQSFNEDAAFGTTENAALTETNLDTRAQVRKNGWIKQYWLPSIVVLLLIVLFATWLVVIRYPGFLQPQRSIAELEGNRWAFAPDMKIPRSGLAVAAVDDLIYAISGENDKGITSQVEQFNASNLSWKRLVDKPTPVADVSAAVVGGKIYIPGGRMQNGTITDALEIYDPRADLWIKGASLPFGLSAYALAALEGKIYLFGGWDGEKFSDKVFEYDPSSDYWDERTKLSIPRGYAGASPVGGKIYLVGGNNGARDLDLVEAYSPNLDDGVGSPWSQKKSLPDPRSGIGVIGIADYLYVIGRDQQIGLSTALIYTPVLDEWSEFATPIDLPWSRMGVLASGNHIYALGGLMDGKPSAQNLTYQAIFTILLPVIR